MPLSTFRNHPYWTALGAFFALLLALVVLLVVFAKPFIKAMGSQKTGETIGREFAIDGDFDIDWRLPLTRVHVEKIRMGNKEGYKEPSMVTIETLDFTFKPLKLLLGRLEFGDITLDKPVLVLEKKSPSDMNWDFPALSNAHVTSEAALPNSRRNFPIIGKLELKNGTMIYRDAVRGLDLNLELETVSGEGGGKKDEKNFSVSGAGQLQKQKFQLDAKGGSLSMLRDTSQDYPLDLKLVMGPTEVLLNGTFNDPIKMTGANTALQLKGNNLADLFYLTAIPLPPTPAYLLKGQLTKTGDVWAWNEFSGKVGDSDLSGNLSYDTSGDRGLFKADLVSKRLDGKDLGGFIGLTNDRPKASTKLIPDVPLKLERLRAADMDVTFKADKINAPGIPFKGMDVRFHLKDGVLKLDPLHVTLADGSVDGTIEIDGQKDVPPMAMNLNLKNLSLGQFFANTRFAQTTKGTFGGKVHLAGQGLSLAEVLGTSNGEFTIIMSDGVISLLLVEASDLDIGQALPLLLGKDKSTRIRCGVMDFNVKRGLLTSKIFVLDTTDSLLLGNVTIDLKRELINAKLDAKPKDNSLFSAQTPITVQGKLKKPSVGIDVAEAGLRGAAAAALGVALTPFAAILPFIETADVKNADCRRLITEAKN